MSKRKRSFARTASPPQIGWLKHRTGYPSPDERQAIIRMRDELRAELLMMMVTKVKPDSPRAQALYKKYGKEEVERAIQKIDEGMETPSFIADEARSYRDYRWRYARFGAGLKFLSSEELEASYMDFLAQVREGKDSEAGRLLLVDWRDWEDITPPAVPPRPSDFTSPAPASYSAPINELLDWGDDLKRSHEFEDETEYIQWRKHIPALTRMALDPGLLHGWPSEPASWAPWHAIHALGNLQAWESAPALAALADIENDWLSDHLPHIWADMGTEAEPALWMILENPSASAKERGLAAESLRMSAGENEAMEHKVVRGFQKILQNAVMFNATVNGYLINFLNTMDALEEVEETVNAAFEAGRVDPEVITPEDLYEDEDDEFDNEDFDNDDLFEDEDENEDDETLKPS
jgi:hypothetical protein